MIRLEKRMINLAMPMVVPILLEYSGIKIIYNSFLTMDGC